MSAESAIKMICGYQKYNIERITFLWKIAQFFTKPEKIESVIIKLVIGTDRYNSVVEIINELQKYSDTIIPLQETLCQAILDEFE